MMQKETTHGVWVIFTGRLLSRASCSIRQVYHTHSHSVNQPLRTGSALRNRIWRGNVYVDGTREVELNKEGEETRQKSRERVTEKVRRRERGNKSWLTQTLRSHLNTDRNVETQAFTFIRVWECWSSVSPVVFTNTEPTWLTLHPASPGHQRLPLAAWWDCPRSASSAACEDRETWLEVVETERRETEEETERFQCEYFRVWLLLSLIDKSAVKSLDSLIRRVFCFVWPTIQNPKKNCLHA